jgi:hypothetical protein
MKLSKEDLKGIVKECLVEILSEGLAGSSSSINESRNMQRVTHSASPAQRQVAGRAATTPVQQQRTTVYDKLAFTPSREQIQKVEPIAKKINPLSMVKDITTDPVMASILAETAASGQHMNMGERDRPSHDDQIMTAGDAAAKKMMMSDPTELFSESASMWSALAFSEPLRK